jgi:hypothetical protein
MRAKILARKAIKTIKTTMAEEPDQEEKLNQSLHPTPNNEILLGYIEELQQPNEVWINTKTSNTIEFHLKYDKKKEELPLEQLIPEEYREYLDVFDEGKADRFPGPHPCSFFEVQFSPVFSRFGLEPQP